MRRADLAALAVLIASIGQPCAAAPQIVVPAGTLGHAITVLGERAGLSIGLTDQSLARLRVPAVEGAMTVEQALARLLTGLPARAERIDATTWRIVRAAGTRVRPPRPRARQTPPLPVSAEIVVTASKRGTSLASYPGSVYLLSGGALTAQGARGSEAIVEQLPTLSATALGPGRNKLFIRGIADSSFNGPSQATIGEYLGEVRLTYSAPDPNLMLVDIAAVEVLEGPQGTLYGAATLGGVLRIVPNVPDSDGVSARVTGGLAATAHGRPSGDATAMLNLPLVDAAALRFVAYHAVDGGYVDDPSRGARDINRAVTRGGRGTVRLTPGAWTIDVGGAWQAINSRDGQYATRDIGPLARSSLIAQPSDNDYGLGSLSVTRAVGDTTLRASAGLVGQNLDSKFDFTPAGGAVNVFGEQNRIRLASGEVSLAQRAADSTGWIGGVSAFANDQRLTRTLGPPNAALRILGVRNRTTNLSAFGDYGAGLGNGMVASVGIRLDYAHLVGSPLDVRTDEAGEVRRNALRFLPSLAISWRTGGTTLFARYQEGFRPGGLSVSDGGGAVQRFRGDSLKMAEAGARFTDLAGSGVDGVATLSYAHWEGIQADLVDTNGLPFTANVGTGRIVGAEAQLARALGAGLRMETALFVNQSQLTRPAAFLGASDDPSLPNVAKVGARSTLALAAWPIARGLTLDGDATIRYVGHSRLGVGPSLGLLQGGYVDTSARARIGSHRAGVTVSLSNLFDARGNRFALGNPFDVARGMQTVPLRPRTIRLGIDAHF